MPARPRVYLGTRVPAEVELELARDFELVAAVDGVDGVVVTPAVVVDGAFLDAAGPDLRVVANYAVGTDNVDLEAARRRGIVVSNTPDVLTNAAAEFTIALMLALLRRVCEGDRMIRRRAPWRISPEFMLGESFREKELLVVGPGRIGRRVAQLAEHLGARPVLAGRDGDLRALLPGADFVTLHCPLTPETRHLIGAEAFALMKPTSILVNTSRGPVVDEAALVAALRAGSIAGAALDVYELEPDVSEELLALENVVLTPHIASAERSTRLAMGMLCVSALRAVLVEDRIPPNAV